MTSMTAILDALAAGRDAEAGQRDRPHGELPRGRPDDAEGDGGVSRYRPDAPSPCSASPPCIVGMYGHRRSAIVTTSR